MYIDPLEGEEAGGHGGAQTAVEGGAVGAILGGLLKG
jgi:hypothetical protein